MEEVYKVASFRMSKQKMSDVMYAIIMSKAKVTTSYGVGIYEYDRSQNAYNQVDFMLCIPKEKVNLFEELSGIELSEPTRIRLNNGRE